MIVDAQVHIWAADRPDRPWPKGEAPRPHREVPLSAQALLKEMDEAGVDRAILIPPSWEGNRDDLVLEAADSYPDKFRAFCRLPVQESEGRPLIGELSANRGLSGFRFTFHKEHNRRGLTDGTADWIWPAAEEAGIPVMIHAPRGLDAVEAIARKHPGLRIVVDHLAMERPNKDEEAVKHFPALFRLANYPNVAVKATALPSYSSESYPFPKLREPIRQVVAEFGAERVFWGSDMTRVDLPYRQIVTHFTEELPFLSEAERKLIMGEALCKWLGWPISNKTDRDGKQ